MGNNFWTVLTASTLWKYTHLNVPFGELDRAITYLKNVIVSCDGDITWAAGTLTWSDTIRIHFNRADGYAIQNTIAASNIALADNEFAYITLSETNDAVITVSKAAITTAAASNFIAYNRLVLGYRNTTSDEFYAVHLKNVWTVAAEADTGELDPTPASDHTYSGPHATMTAGEALVFGEVCYLKSDGKWWKADADAATTMPGMAMAAATIDADATGDFILPGAFVRDDTWNWTVGASEGLIYVDTPTAGAPTQTAPPGTGDQVQIIGYAYTVDIMYFNPSPVLVEVA
jgi:hypothetical protein